MTGEVMTTKELDVYFKNLLNIGSYGACDASLNGIQVDNDGADVRKIAFAVDAAMETFRRAKEAGAGLVFVHHGLFWGVPLALEGGHRERIAFLLANNIALYACHLPLDAAPEVGNNAVLAGLLGIEHPVPFGDYHGKRIGYKGNLAKPLRVHEAVKRIAFMDREPIAVYAFGKELCETAAVISGGAAPEVIQAIDEGIDLYVTGEASHSFYYTALEAKINVIAGGHYNTEVYGARAVMERVKKDLGLDAEFIDMPTGL
jgi:dinuclear metal center YbgI/SA1388 family protein